MKKNAEFLFYTSFSADTKVATKDGEKAISKIQIGDFVLAWNSETNQISFYRVTDTIHHTDRTIVKLTIGDETIATTPEHPFYVEGKGWVYAKDLKVGDSIRKADGSTGKVKNIKIEQSTQEMYNVTVGQAHTFFVGEGQWLVHNCPARNIGPGQWETANESMSARAADYQAQITGRYGDVYRVNGVKFDGYNNGTLLDAKGPGYAKFVKNGQFQPWFSGADGLLDEAGRQIIAANGTPIEWHVAEQGAVGAIRTLLAENGYSIIDVIWTPMIP